MCYLLSVSFSLLSSPKLLGLLFLSFVFPVFLLYLFFSFFFPFCLSFFFFVSMAIAGVFLGVRNRSQADIREGKSVRECLEEEKIFFASHPTYRLLPPHLVGVSSLVDKLTKVLFRHIKNFLPEIKREIGAKTRVVLDRLQELGEVKIQSSSLFALLALFFDALMLTSSVSFSDRRSLPLHRLSIFLSYRFITHIDREIERQRLNIDRQIKDRKIDR